MIHLAARLLTRYSHVNWALADQAMVSGVNFLTAILLARYLGLEEFGRFTLAWMAVLFVNSIQHAAINSPMMSIGPMQSEAEAPAYYGAVMVQQVVFGILTFAVVWAGVSLGAVQFPGWRVADLALPLACAAIAYQCQDFLRRHFFTRGRGITAFTNDALRYLGQLLLLIWLFQTTAMDSARAIWVIAGTAAIAALYGAFLIERPAWSPRTLRTTTSRHWNFGKWLTATALMRWTSGNLFIIFAGVLLGAAAVGALKAAQTLMGVTHILFMGLENVVPIRAAQHFHDGGKKALLSYLKRVTMWGGGATATVSAVAAIAPDFWLGLVFGDQYVEYGYLLRWWALISLLIFLSLSLRFALRAIEHTRAIFWSQLWVVIFTTLFAYPLTKYFDLLGVVIGILMLYVILITTLLHSFRKRLS